MELELDGSSQSPWPIAYKEAETAYGVDSNVGVLDRGAFVYRFITDVGSDEVGCMRLIDLRFNYSRDKGRPCYIYTMSHGFLYCASS